MPVYDQHYHPWGGKARPRWLRWTVITRYHLRQLFTGKGRNALIALLLIAGAIHLAFLAYIYFSANTSILESYHIPTNQLVQINAEFFLYPLMAQSFIVGFLTLIVGSGLIADDRRDNAIPLYLSKPLTSPEYLFGKFSVVGFFILAVTGVPVNVLFLFQVLIGGGWSFLKEYWWLPLSITTLSLAITAVCGSGILLASSLVKKGAFAGIVAIGLLIANQTMATLLVQTLNAKKMMLLSLPFDFRLVGLWLFRIASREFTFTRCSGPEAAWVLAAVVAVSWTILLWRLRPVEVVK